MYILLLALIYLAFISLGLPDSLLGSAWPAMQEIFSVPISYMGFISMIISPYVMSWALVNSSWQGGCRIVSGIQAAIAVILVLTLSVWKVNQKIGETAEETPILGVSGIYPRSVCPHVYDGGENLYQNSTPIRRRPL